MPHFLILPGYRCFYHLPPSVRSILKTEMAKDEQEQLKVFKPGEIITSAATNNRFEVEKLLGEGGFGAVYLVKLQGTENSYALKVEKKLPGRDHSKLKMEASFRKKFLILATTKVPRELRPSLGTKVRKKRFDLAGTELL
uniref:Protein kinase domain-containing protein n=1 Tax=Bursaphelenchus xylophilus TaxID=6326 RepID=A0A1I7RM11_BURXY